MSASLLSLFPHSQTLCLPPVLTVSFHYPSFYLFGVKHSEHSPVAELLAPLAILLLLEFYCNFILIQIQLPQRSLP